MVDTFYRSEDGKWKIETLTGLETHVVLKSISCEVPMADIYSLVARIDEG